MKENNVDEVLIIGLPNSGKSTLINTISSSKISIVGSKPNTTRDKVSKEIYLNNKNLIISDLPGYLENPDELNIMFQHKLNEYIDNAKIILFVIDVNTKNYNALDKINKLLRETKNKNIFTVFNKCENFNNYELDKNLYKYIFDQDFYVSSIHKIGIDELTNTLTKHISSSKSSLDISKRNSIVLLGKPNSGKSTLFNSLLKRERAIVSSISGTTRDAIKDIVVLNNKKYQLIDTAGVPRNKQKNQIDRYASILSLDQINKSLVTLLVVDSTVGFSYEDLRLLNECDENNSTPILILNKWDLLDLEEKELIDKKIKNNLKKFNWINILKISAITRKGIQQIEKSLIDIHDQLNLRIPTSDLNIFFREIWVSKPPHPFRGKRSKLKYVTQYDIEPPSFSLNLNGRIPKNYESFINNSLRNKYGFNNVSISIKYNL